MYSRLGPEERPVINKILCVCHNMCIIIITLLLSLLLLTINLFHVVCLAESIRNNAMFTICSPHTLINTKLLLYFYCLPKYIQPTPIPQHRPHTSVISLSTLVGSREELLWALLPPAGAPWDQGHTGLCDFRLMWATAAAWVVHPEPPLQCHRLKEHTVSVGLCETDRRG